LSATRFGLPRTQALDPHATCRRRDDQYARGLRFSLSIVVGDHFQGRPLIVASGVEKIQQAASKG
jgi:hypothetical protein